MVIKVELGTKGQLELLTAFKVKVTLPAIISGLLGV